MKTEYGIIYARDARYVERETTKALNSGWKCQGGLSVSVAFTPSGSEKQLFAQAIIREIEDDT